MDPMGYSYTNVTSTSLRHHWDGGLDWGNYSKMAALFRLYSELDFLRKEKPSSKPKWPYHFLVWVFSRASKISRLILLLKTWMIDLVILWFNKSSNCLLGKQFRAVPLSIIELGSTYIWWVPSILRCFRWPGNNVGFWKSEWSIEGFRYFNLNLFHMTLLIFFRRANHHWTTSKNGGNPAVWANVKRCPQE